MNIIVDLGLNIVELTIVVQALWVAKILLQFWKVSHVIRVLLNRRIGLEQVWLQIFHQLNEFKEEEVDPSDGVSGNELGVTLKL